jgi:formylglycine-generating enzyme required for sulfatase activity
MQLIGVVLTVGVAAVGLGIGCGGQVQRTSASFGPGDSGVAVGGGQTGSGATGASNATASANAHTTSPTTTTPSTSGSTTSHSVQSSTIIGAAPTGPNCATADAGATACGSAGSDCCTSPSPAGGTFYRTYTTGPSGPIDEANPATVSAFRLDTFLVTVGRFRPFVAAWKAGYLPPSGSGKHAHLAGGMGLVLDDGSGSYEPGWSSGDNAMIAPTDTNLACSNAATWTPAPSGHENLPINCLNWYEAYAFCIWDGGFLPSEAEWEYAAAGGSDQRAYPWGSADPGTASQYAIYGCYYPSGSQTCAGLRNVAPVGSAPLGAGRWGQLDLGGEAWEWILDSNGAYVDPCADCVSWAVGAPRTLRGADYGYVKESLAPSGLDGGTPAENGADPQQRSLSGYAPHGVRCARTP